MTNLRELALLLANQIGGKSDSVVARAEDYYTFLTDKRQTDQNVTAEEQAARAAGGVQGLPLHGQPTWSQPWPQPLGPSPYGTVDSALSGPLIGNPYNPYEQRPALNGGELGGFGLTDLGQNLLRDRQDLEFCNSSMTNAKDHQS